MSVTVGTRPGQPGLNSILDRMKPEHANNLRGNEAVMNKFQTFMGPSDQGGAGMRMKQIAHILGKTTNIKRYVKQYAQTAGLGREQTQELWIGVVQAIASGDASNLKSVMKAGAQGTSSSMEPSWMSGFSSADNGLDDAEDEYLAKIRQRNYLTSNLTHPSTEFAQEMTLSAIIPIAKTLIPNTVATKAFITDSAVGQLSKPYVMKKRYPAYMQGLAEEAQGLHPTQVVDYDTMLVTPREWKRTTSIDMKWVETMEFDVAADQLSDGGRELQVLIDQMFFRMLDFLVPNNGGFPGAGSTINGYTVDATGTCLMFETGRNPQVEDLNAANSMLRTRGYNPDLLITSPYELGCMMSEQAILMAYAYGNREVQETGLVGSLVGNAVAWTPNTWQGGGASPNVVWVCDSDELARIVLGWPISLWPDFSRRRMDFELYTRLVGFIRNSNACVKLCYNN